MITITAQINLISGNNNQLSISDFTRSGNNISSGVSSVVGKKKEVGNPFIIGASKLGDGATFSNAVDYFIGDQLSDENGVFASPYELNINTSNTANLIALAFDTQNNRHPKSIEVIYTASGTQNSTTFVDDDATFTLSKLPQSDDGVYKIRISNWNAPKYPFVLSGIYVNISIDINKKNLISFNRRIFDRSDIKLPSYGIISNTGNIEFNDLDGEVRDYAEQRLLEADLKVVIRLVNTLGNIEQIGNFQTREWNYDNQSRVVSVSLKDNLEEWQDIYVEGFSYDPRNPYGIMSTAAGLYVWLSNKTPSKYVLPKFNALDARTQSILSNTKIPYPLLESGTLWQQWTKLCQLCGLYIYKKPNGAIACTYTYGS